MTELDKAVALFEEGLEHSRLRERVSVVSSSIDGRVDTLELVVSVPDVADWDLRYAVLRVAQTLEDDHQLRAICVFRPAEDLVLADPAV